MGGALRLFSVCGPSMKLFQQLLVAPAALGLLAPVAANAADINVDAMAEYAPSSQKEQVTSITQFSDVYPTDWAYQALANLIERYGCVAGYPNGTFRGNRAMTRYEAAALLNACLDRITEITDELRRLIKEFERELAIIRGRVGELEATQFSTTTKLKGVTFWAMGANKFHGNATQGILDAAFGTNAAALNSSGFVFDQNDQPVAVIDLIGMSKKEMKQLKRSDFFGTKRSDEAAAQSGAFNFGYDLRLAFDTSFTGKDLLRARLRSGNFGNPYGGAGYVGLHAQEYGFGSGNKVMIDRVFYKFPIGSNFTITAGPRVRQDDMLAAWPSAYPEVTTMDFFTYAGAPGAYNLTLGGGAGISWSNNGWSASVSYLSGNAEEGNPEYGGGIGTDAAASNTTVQLGYGADNWGVYAAYNKASGDNGAGLYVGNATPLAYSLSTMGVTNSVGLSAYWTPEDAGWIPSISAGWGLNDVGDTSSRYIKSATSQSWYVGLMWDDVFLQGNTFGMAVGQPTFVTDVQYRGGYKDNSDFVADGNYAWEWWYKFQVTDNISITPALYYLSRPYGDLTDGGGRAFGGDRKDKTFNSLGTLVKTTFTF